MHVGLRRARAAMRLRYEEHTWPELRELAKRDDLVVVIPTATLEDHGHHLPVDTDARLVSAICERAVPAADGQALLFPTQVHGYTPHHMDFPGSVTLRWNVFVEALVDQGRSLCRHGFDRILFVNGHGSNQPLVDIAARLIGVEHRDAVCGSCFYLQSAEAKRVIAEVRDSPHPGGMAHACELETSLYLALRARPRADGQGGARDPRLGLRARLARLVRRPAPGVAALVRASAAAEWSATRLWPPRTRASGCFPPRWMRYVPSSARSPHVVVFLERITMRGSWVAVLAALLVVRDPCPGAGEEGPQDRLGAGPADAQPVHRPGRGELPDLGDQLRPARQLQPRQPRPVAGHRRELGRLRRQEDRSPSSSSTASSGPTGSRSRARTSSTASRCSAATACCSPATPRTSPRSRRPTTRRSIVKTKKPDTRIVGGIFVYIIPKHIWGKQTVKQLMGSYRPKPPIVGSGPYIVTEFDSNRLVRMERNPNWRGKKPAFDELQWIKYGSADAVERALTLGEVDMMHRGQAGDLRAARARPRTSRPSRRRRRRSPSWRSTCARATTARTRSTTRRSRTGRCARRSASPSTASGSTRSPRATRRSPATGCCPCTTRTSTRSPRASSTTRTTSTARDEMLDARGLGARARAACARRTASGSRSTSSCARSRRRTSRPRGW